MLRIKIEDMKQKEQGMEVTYVVPQIPLWIYSLICNCNSFKISRRFSTG